MSVTANTSVTVINNLDDIAMKIGVEFCKFNVVANLSKTICLSTDDEALFDYAASMLKVAGVQCRLVKWVGNPFGYLIITIGEHFTPRQMIKMAQGGSV